MCTILFKTFCFEFQPYEVLLIISCISKNKKNVRVFHTLTYNTKNISRWYLIDFKNSYTKKKSFLIRMKNAFHTESNLLMENECEEKLIKALQLSYKSTLSFSNSLYAILKELSVSLRYCLTLSCGRNQFSIIRNFGLRRYTKKFSVIIIRSFLHFYKSNIIDLKLSYLPCQAS